MTPKTTPNAADRRRCPIPQPALGRLPWYLAAVSALDDAGVEYISSTQLSRRVNVEATQIAKDLSYLGIRGKTRIGYEVAALNRSLVEFLGFRRSHKAVIAGVGSLGSALLADSGLHRYGLDIVAALDINPSLIGTVMAAVGIHHIDHAKHLVQSLHAEIGVLAVPADCAQEVADRLVDAGVKAIWNFTPCRIAARDGVVVQDTSIYAHLAVMYHNLDAVR